MAPMPHPKPQKCFVRLISSALTLTKYLFRTAAEAAKVLGVDANEAADWLAAAGRLAPYPTFQTDEGPVWVDVAGAPPCPDRGMWSSLRNRSTAITFVRSDGDHFPL